MIINNKTGRCIYPNFDSGTYIGSWTISDDRVQQAYINQDKHILERLNIEILVAMEKVLMPYTESNKYVVGDYIIPKDDKNAEPLKIIKKNENSFTVFSEEKQSEHEIMFIDLFKVQLKEQK